METEKCTALLTVLKQGSLKAAADRLGYTVSGISRMMAALEEEMGFPLLVRSHSGVSPTQECTRLLPILEELVHSAEHCRQLAAEIRGLEVGSVTVGVCYNIYYRRLAAIIADFRRLYPHIQVNIVDDMRSSDMMTALNRRQVDLCFISRREETRNWLHLKHDELVAILSRKNPLSRLSAVPTEAFRTEPYILIYPDRDTDNSRMLASKHIEPNVRYTCSSVSAAFSLAAADLGITLVNTLEIIDLPPELAALPLSPSYFVDVGIAMPPPEEQPPAVQRFVAYLTEHFTPDP